MTKTIREDEHCAVCGKALGGDRGFCRFYEAAEPVSLCSPDCASIFLRRPANPADPGASWEGTLESEPAWVRR